MKFDWIKRRQRKFCFERLESRRLLVSGFDLIDINQRPESTGSQPDNLVSIGNIAYFTANVPEFGRELWKSNGTLAGTELVKDLLLGPISSDPRELTVVGNQLFFTAENSSGSRDLWRSDGTTAGTIQLTTELTRAYVLTNVNGILFFSARNNTNGTELWKSDGSAAGTVLVKDIRSGSSSSYPSQLANVNGSVFFRANGGEGAELWKSDGTAAGTVLVKDIRPGASGSGVSEIVDVNGTAYFRANNGSNGYELWKSNGTESGTLLVKDINPGSGDRYPAHLTNVNGVLFFAASDGSTGVELWKSNGIVTETVIVKDIRTGASSSGPTELFNFNGTLFFSATDDALGRELWTSNGTSAGTTIVKDLSSGALSSGPSNFTKVGSEFTFFASSSSGLNLWKSNGTTAGTVLVKSQSLLLYGDTQVSANVNGSLFFSARSANGMELWKSDGTTNGTVEVRNIRQGTNSSSLRTMTPFAGSLYFVADDGVSGFELWKSTGTEAGTTLVKDIRPGFFSSSPRNLTVVGDTLFFSATNSDNGSELWKTDGTASGTVLVKDIRPGSAYSIPRYFVNHNGLLFFTANDGTHGHELWKSDGTEAGTVQVKDILPGNAGAEPKDFVSIGNSLFFTANDGAVGRELWKTSGTAASTVLVDDLKPGAASSYVTNLTAIGNTLFFTAEDDPLLSSQLWKSNGTPSGTVRLTDYSRSFYPAQLTNFNGSLFFIGRRGQRTLWKSDGTVEGTVQLEFVLDPDNLTVANEVIMFSTEEYVGTASAGALWRTDGTESGTSLVKLFDAFDDFASVIIKSMSSANGTLYFSPRTASNGFELWTSDATAEGTTLVQDFEDGEPSSNPGAVLAIGNVLFVSATTLATGTELYVASAIAPSASLAIVPTSADKAEGNAGTTSNFTFTVTRSGNVSGTTTVNYTVTGIGSSPASANDFAGGVFPSGQVTFAAGQTSRVISVLVQRDLIVEADESFQVSLAGPSGGATLTTASAVGVIRNDDTSLAIAATSADKAEGNSGTTTNFTFTVTRSGNVSGTTTVNYTVTGIGSSPASANDFAGGVFPSGQVTFAAGQTSRVISVLVQRDLIVEADESFQVSLAGPSGGATLTTASAVGIIRNDDTSLAIAPTSADKVEGNSGTTTNFTFTVTRSGNVSGTTTVNYAVSGSSTPRASANDFAGGVFPSGQVSFAAGQTSRVISVLVQRDLIVEADENFRVTLSSPSGGTTLTTASAVGVIRNDDTSLAIVATSANKVEGQSGISNFTFTVTRNGSTTGSAAVDYAVTGNGANPADVNDFLNGEFPAGQVTFVTGQTSRVISIPVQRDRVVEPNESFRVTLSHPSSPATLAASYALGLIVNDDSLGTSSMIGFNPDPSRRGETKNDATRTVAMLDWMQSPLPGNSTGFIRETPIESNRNFEQKSYMDQPIGPTFAQAELQFAIRMLDEAIEAICEEIESGFTSEGLADSISLMLAISSKVDK